MTFGRIIAACLVVAIGLAIPFFLLLFGWISVRAQIHPHTLPKSLPRLSFWFASSSLVLELASLVHFEMIAPSLPGVFWIVLKWTSAVCWMLVAVFEWFAKRKQRAFLLIWWFVFPIFVGMLVVSSYAY
jgi:hypothetical protein